MATQPAFRPTRMIPLATTDDESAARRWLGALEAVEIPAELRIEDARRMGNSSSVLPLGPVFATTLYVAAERRTQAAAVLIDLGWDGRQIGAGVGERPIPRSSLIGGGVAAAVGAVALIVAILLRGA
ncbi:MAG: hypothetical protein WC211_03335 [Dehalococcoidia bacterium]